MAALPHLATWDRIAKSNDMIKSIAQILTWYGDYVDSCDDDVADKSKDLRGGTATVFKKLPNDHYLAITCAHNLVLYDSMYEKKTKPVMIYFFPKGQTNDKFRLSVVDSAIYDKYDPSRTLCRNDIAIVLLRDRKGATDTGLTGAKYFQNIEVNENIKLMKWEGGSGNVAPLLNLWGYPTTSGGELQGQNQGEATAENNLWIYKRTLYTYGGHSGAPLYETKRHEENPGKYKYQIYGIHIHGDIDKQKNCAVFLDDTKLKWIADTEDKFTQTANATSMKPEVIPAPNASKKNEKNELKNNEEDDESVKPHDNNSKNNEVEHWLKETVGLEADVIDILFHKGYGTMRALRNLNKQHLTAMDIKEDDITQIMQCVRKLPYTTYKRPRDDDSDEDRQAQSLLISIDNVKNSARSSQDVIHTVSSNEYKIDDAVVIMGKYKGCIRFIGINIAANMLLYGVEVDEVISSGSDGGCYHNVRYFKYKPGHALFVESSQIVRFWNDYLDDHEKAFVSEFLSDMLSIKDCSTLKVGDEIDHRYEPNRTFFGGTIIEKDESNLKIRYKAKPGDDEVAIWSDYTQELYRFAKHQSITTDPFSRLLKHAYDRYFKLHKDPDHTIFKKLKWCLYCIKTRIVPNFKQESRGALVEYLCALKNKLFEEFMVVQLKERINNDIVYAQIKADFDEMYCSVVNALAQEDDVFHLGVSKAIVERGSYEDDDTIKKIQLKWETILEEGKMEMNCDDDCYNCISINRMDYLLQLLQTFFIDKHQSNDNDIDELNFVSIFNCLSHYDRIEAINDFNHIKDQHIGDLYTFSYLIRKCPHQVCILNERIVENKRSHRNINHDGFMLDNYFGFMLDEEINLIQFFIKVHAFISHRGCLLRYNKNTVKPAPINTESHKFATTVPTTEQKEEEKDNEFAFGQQFFYKKHFEKEQDCNYIAKPYFPNLKDELLHNDIYPLRINIFNSQFLRAQDLVLSKKGKQMKALNKGINNVKYEVAVDAPITMSHMLCVLVYTNMTELQYAFKQRGCRRESQNDDIDAIAQRNVQIGNWYKLFMEMVLIYGVFTKRKNKFYHGLSVKLLFSSFNPIFKCPISTTTEIHVAQQFADGGIILALKSTATSGDSYLDVSWISNYPEECERLFSFARNLTIYDIRFSDDRNECRDSHYVDLCALRLFDSIYKSNSAYKASILGDESQQMLILYIAKYNYCHIVYDITITFMDQLYIFNRKTYEEYDYEEYDSDAFWYDCRYLQNNDKDKFTVFKQFIQHQKKISDIPQYLMELFTFMVNDVKQQKNIFMIESEYDNKLQRELRNALCTLKLPSKRFEYIKEFKWKIVNKELETFQNLKVNEDMKKGHGFTFGTNEKIVIVPYIKKSATEWRNNCEIGIQMTRNISSDASVKVSWSFLIEKTKYSMKEHHKTLKLDGHDGYKSFSNKGVNDLQSLTVTFFIRLD